MASLGLEEELTGLVRAAKRANWAGLGLDEGLTGLSWGEKG